MWRQQTGGNRRGKTLQRQKKAAGNRPWRHWMSRAPEAGALPPPDLNRRATRAVEQEKFKNAIKIHSAAISSRAPRPTKADTARRN